MKKLMFIFLMLIGWMSGNGQCYLVLGSFSGLENLHSPELDSAACELIEDISFFRSDRHNSTRNTTFIVFSYDLYYLALYKNESNYVLNQIQTITQELSENYDYYLGVIKHVNDGKIEYSVTMDLSGYSIFGGYSEEDFHKLETEIAQIMQITYQKENQNVAAEKAGLKYLSAIISQLQSGSYYQDEGQDANLINHTLINNLWVSKVPAWYVSLAGIPLYLPQGTWVRFVKGSIARECNFCSFPTIPAQGMVFQFQVGGKNYFSCFDPSTGDFTGYCQKCGDLSTIYKLSEGDIGNNNPEFKSFSNPGFVVFSTVESACKSIHVAEYKYDCPWSDPNKRASGTHKTRTEVKSNFLNEIKIFEVVAIEPGYQPVVYNQQSYVPVIRNISYIPYPCINNFTEQELNVFLESSIIFFKEFEGKIYPFIPTKHGHLTYWDDNNLIRHYFVYHKTLGWRPVDIEKYSEAEELISSMLELASTVALWGIRAGSIVIPVVGSYRGFSLATILAIDVALAGTAYAIHQDNNEIYLDLFFAGAGFGVDKLFKTLDLIQNGNKVLKIGSPPFQTLEKQANDVLINSPKAEYKTFGKLKEEFPKTISESGGLTKAQKWEKFAEDLDIIRDGGHDFSILFSAKGIKVWEKLLKQGSSVSQILRKDIKTLEWFAKHNDNIPKSAADDLLAALDKPIKETIEDAQGRLTYVLDRPGQSNKVVSVHETSNGQFKTTTYSPAYNPHLNPSIPIPLSANKLTPDYINSASMHPLQGNTVVKIELSGDRAIDFARSRAELGITQAQENAAEYVWHHMDDFEIINGKAYGTMQLVERSAHSGTGVLGMQHSGSAAQWRAYYSSGY